jgi:hypothetical protein
MIWWLLFRWGSTAPVVSPTTVGHVTTTAYARGTAALAAHARGSVSLGAQH